MATPKIKLYRLSPGYSSQNDTDIQNATNDQLLPVSLKNIMPTNAYNLVGVSQKEKQALIPILYMDAFWGTENKYITCDQDDNTGEFIIPISCITISDQNSIFDSMDSINQSNFINKNFIISNLTQTDRTNTEKIKDAYLADRYKNIVVSNKNLMPVFCKKITSDAGGSVTYKQYQPNKDYIFYKYLSSSNKYGDSEQFTESGASFYFYYSNQYKQFRVYFPQDAPTVLYVRNIYCMILSHINVQLQNVTSTSNYYLSKNSTNQLVNSTNDFIPAYGDYLENFQSQYITFQQYTTNILTQDQMSSLNSENSNNSYTSDSLQTITLTRQQSNFSIDQKFILSDINSKTQIKIGNYTYQIGLQFIYNKNINLYYNIIPNCSQLKYYLPYNLLFMTQYPYIYNGTQSATKPNTIYLQLVQSDLISNVSYEVNNDDSLTTTLSSPTTYCRGIIKDIQSTAMSFSGGTGRPVYTLQDTDFVKQYFTNKQLNFPAAQYILDPDKGVFYFDIAQDSTEEIWSTSSYLFCDYYYRNSPVKLFISDYQSWVTEHLRNNPDIFYGKKDYAGDDYIDANDNAITVGVIPRYIESGYTIAYRNGSVTFGANTQDASFTGTAQVDNGVSTDSSGNTVGGVARANFAFYNGIQNVIDQKLDYDTSYVGGGYKYRALNDKVFPESIGKRWVKRSNTLQFIGASFITQKLNDQGQLTTYNLPDIATIQQQSLTMFGFVKGYAENDDNYPNKIIMNYYITTNNFSYPFTFKISNRKKITDTDTKQFVSILSNQTLKNKYYVSSSSSANLTDTTITEKFMLDANYFEKNNIYFATVQGDEIDHIIIDYNETNILPALKVTIPIISDVINLINQDSIVINKNKRFKYSNFSVYYFNTSNQLTKLDDIQYLQDSTNNQIVVNFEDIKSSYPNISNIYLKYYETTVLFFSYNQYDQKGNKIVKTLENCKLPLINTDYQDITVTQFNVQSSTSSDSSGSSFTNQIYSIPTNYKCSSPNSRQLLFSVSNVSQTTYFCLRVLDFYTSNLYTSGDTVVYEIKKCDL